MAYNGNQNPFENPSGRPRKSKDERRQSFRVRRRKWLYEWRNGGTNMTVILIALCVFFWLIAEILYFTNRPALAVYESAFVLRSDQSLAHPWTLLTVLFMHSIDISHIFFNMVSLYLAACLWRECWGTGNSSPFTWSRAWGLRSPSFCPPWPRGLARLWPA